MAVPQLRRRPWQPTGCTDECRATRAALLRLLLATTHPIETVVQTGALTIDHGRRAVFVEQQEVVLSERQWAILDYLAANVGRVCSVAEILTACWGPESAGDDRLFRTQLSRLRWKLGPCQDLIENILWRGYRLRADAPEDNGPLPPLLPRWAKAWDRCCDCKTTERPHGGLGFCTRCSLRRRRRRRAAAGGAPCSD
jgi:DNA-binding winged helix-turn-helix (wHTH) protein